MSEYITFEYELGGNTLICEAEIEHDLPATQPDLNGPGEPEEYPTIEVGDCYLKGFKGADNERHPFDPTGIFTRKWKSTEMVELTEAIAEAAFEKFESW